MLSALISGGLLGTLGSIFTNVLGFFKLKQEHKQNLELKRLDIQKMGLMHKYQLTSQEVEASIRREESADDMVEASFKHDATFATAGIKNFSFVERFMLVTLDFVRALVRPALTVFLIWQVHLTRVEINAVLKASNMSGLSTIDALNIYQEVIRMILFLASTATCWWFGSRPPKGGKPDGVPKRLKTKNVNDSGR